MGTTLRSSLAAAAALMACAGFAQAATVDSCRSLIGMSTGTAAWGAVVAAGDTGAFLGNKDTANCSIKVVGTSAKGKPGTTYIMAGPMTADECSMYNHLSSTDSKLNQAKVGEAYTMATSTVAKVNSLYSTGKLTLTGFNSLYPATVAIQSCVAELAATP